MSWFARLLGCEPKAGVAHRRVLISRGEGWVERAAWQDEAGNLWVRSVGDEWDGLLELGPNGATKPAGGNSFQQLYGGTGRVWRDAPTLKLANPKNTEESKG